MCGLWLWPALPRSPSAAPPPPARCLSALAPCTERATSPRWTNRPQDAANAEKINFFNFLPALVKAIFNLLFRGGLGGLEFSDYADALRFVGVTAVGGGRAVVGISDQELTVL